MVARLKKCRKLRGHVSHGHGRIGKARRMGGGRGNAGGQHHHRILMDKFHPGYFGKVGMRFFHYKKNPNMCPTVNLDQLHLLLTEEQRNSKETPTIDLNQHGYFKLLGRGIVTRAFNVKVRISSDKAKERLEKVGGSLTLAA